MKNNLRQLILLSASLMTLTLVGCATGEKKPVSTAEKANLFLMIANGSLLEGDPTAALASVMEAEALDPENAAVFHTKALAFFAKKDMDQAIAAARKAVELAPNFSEAQNTLGKLLMDQNENDEAEKHFLIALKNPLYRESFKPATSLGILKYRKGDLASAETFLNKAIQESPVNACVAHYYQGHISLQKGNIEKSIKDYEKASKRLCAGFAEAQFAIGVAYARNKQYEKAREKFLEVKNLYPDSKVAEQAVERLRYIP